MTRPSHAEKSGALQDDSDLWLVFCDEGISLHSLMYTSQQPNDDEGAPSHHQMHCFMLMNASLYFSSISESCQSFLLGRWTEAAGAKQMVVGHADRASRGSHAEGHSEADPFSSGNSACG